MTCCCCKKEEIDNELEINQGKIEVEINDCIAVFLQNNIDGLNKEKVCFKKDDGLIIKIDHTKIAEEYSVENMEKISDNEDIFRIHIHPSAYKFLKANDENSKAIELKYYYDEEKKTLHLFDSYFGRQDSEECVIFAKQNNDMYGFNCCKKGKEDIQLFWINLKKFKEELDNRKIILNYERQYDFVKYKYKQNDIPKYNTEDEEGLRPSPV